MVHRALDLGINFIDTARGYGDSEEKLGVALKGRRDSVFLATKTPSRDKVGAAMDIEKSLRMLQTDYIDLIQLHGVSDQETWEKVMGPNGALEAAKAAQAEGKVRFIGITTHSADIALKELDSGEFVSLMINFNFLETSALEKAIPRAHELGIPVINMKPFGGGAFSNAAVCLKWVFNHGATIAIPGMMTVQEVEENAAVGDMDLTFTPEEEQQLKKQAEEIGAVFCRRCDYCQPCPQSIPISQVLHSYSMTKRMGRRWLSAGHVERLSQYVDNCTECRSCEPRCPYGLKIPELMRERIAYLREQQAQLGIL